VSAVNYVEMVCDLSAHTQEEVTPPAGVSIRSLDAADEDQLYGCYQASSAPLARCLLIVLDHVRQHAPGGHPLGRESQPGHKRHQVGQRFGRSQRCLRE